MEFSLSQKLSMFPNLIEVKTQAAGTTQNQLGKRELHKWKQQKKEKKKRNKKAEMGEKPPKHGRWRCV